MSSLITPPTLPLDSVPPLWGGRRNAKNAPLYGLGWRTSLREIFRKHDVDSLTSVRSKVLTSPARAELTPFIGKIKFNLRFLYDPSVPEGDINNQICFVTFNDKEKNIATLAGPDRDKFIEVVKNVMKMTAEDERSFMWYRCRSTDDL